MRLYCLALACSTVAFSQSFEASVGGGKTIIPSKNADIGGDSMGTYKMKEGTRIGFRMTLNSWRFMGHEFGYAYSRTAVAAPSVGTGATAVPAQTISTPSHQGFYDFLVYAAPEGFVVRPFAAGGVQFTAFSQPGDYGNRETKYGINYGGGLKVKVKPNWGVRLDVRQYNMGKPFKLPNNTGRLLMWEFGGGISFLM
jgi:opacity protein-like surface antigen